MNENEPIVELEDVTEPDENCGWTDQDMLETLIRQGKEPLQYFSQDLAEIYENFVRQVWENLVIPPTTTFVVATGPVFIFKGKSYSCKTRASLTQGEGISLDPIGVAKELSEYMKGCPFFALYMFQLTKSVRMEDHTPQLWVKIRFAIDWK